MIERNPDYDNTHVFSYENSLSPERRKNSPVTVLCGGTSSERPGSIRSGITIADLLAQAGYTHVRKLDVTPDTVLSLADREAVGVAFMAMHGGSGEDGTIQGMLEMMDIPYTGSGIAASSISSDKVLFSRFIRSLGYNVAKQIVADNVESLNGIDITYPQVVKPATQGCSYGVFYVRNNEELMERAPITRQFSDRLILEEYIPGRELTVGVYEDPHSEMPHVLPITENVLAREILDFEAKIPGGEHLYKVVLPAELDSATQEEIEQTCVDIFRQLGCSGYVRMDLRLNKEGKIYILENNTNPGMLNLEESDFPKMLLAGGINPAEFVDLMVEACLINYQKRKRVSQMAPSKEEMMQYLKHLK